MNNQELHIQRLIIVPVLHILRSILESHPQTSNLGFHNENWFHPRYLEKDNEHKNLDDFFKFQPELSGIKRFPYCHLH